MGFGKFAAGYRRLRKIVLSAMNRENSKNRCRRVWGRDGDKPERWWDAVTGTLRSSSTRLRAGLFSFLACSPVLDHSWIYQCKYSLSAHVSLEDTSSCKACRGSHRDVRVSHSVVCFSRLRTSGLLLAVAYEMVLLGVEQLGNFASTRIVFVTDVHPFQNSVCFLIAVTHCDATPTSPCQIPLYSQSS